MFILNFIKNFSITKFLSISLVLGLMYILGSVFFMVNREVQTTNIAPAILTALSEHKILLPGEDLVIFKTLSRFDQSTSLVISTQRLIILKNWQLESINLDQITTVLITSMFLGVSVVRLQTKEHFFEVEIENKNLDTVIKALQINPANVIYQNNIKPA